MIKYCAHAPIQISKGRAAKILKSSVVRVNPIVNMIMPIINDWLVNLFPTKSKNNEKLTQLIKL